MRISDWSSDVCSSDLGSSWFHPPASRQIGQLAPKIGTTAARLPSAALQAQSERRKTPPLGASPRRLAAFGRPGSLKRSSDRKSVVYGKSVSVLVDLGCRSIRNKNTK